MGAGAVPAAREYMGGYRVSSSDLHRELEEDLSIDKSPEGIVDFGVADMGDERAGAHPYRPGAGMGAGHVR